ncbi:hypothetical protein [Chishuiella sp.]|uniref:hypothetical protein n=1 Tax=Chishuiella sp. TaxID=1969467 RepID=UPI0028AA13EA|nr:hypothetical protein [Chishuiella sp.]
MTKKIIVIALLIFSGLHLVAQEKGKNEKWDEMKQINPNLKETDQIWIFDNPQKKYQLELKDNKPYNGYEISKEKLLGEFKFVNYYKNGELVAKYSIDYLAKDQYKSPYEYTIKTTYQNEKVIDGNIYNELHKGILLTDQYKKGIRTGFLVDVFAMHYFNRLNFQLKDNILIINNMQTKNELHIYKKQGLLQADFYADKNYIATSKKNIHKLEKIEANATVVYYMGDKNTLQEFYCIITEPVILENIEDEFLQSIFSQFSFDFEGDMSKLLNNVYSSINNIVELDSSDLSFLFYHYLIPYTEQNLLTTMNYDADGKPKDGTQIKKLDSSKYEINDYEDGKIISTQIVDDLNKIKLQQ